MPRLRPQLVLRNLHVLIGVRHPVSPRLFEISHGAAAEKIRHETILPAVPGIEYRAGSSLAVQFGYGQPARCGGRYFGLEDACRPEDTDVVWISEPAEAEEQFARTLAQVP